MRARLPRSFGRRRFLGRLGAAAAAACRPGGFPAIVRADGARPDVPCGVAVGDVTGGRAVVWSRTDRPARMVVEYATTGSFRDATAVEGPAAFVEDDYTVRVDLEGLPAGQDVFYRVTFRDLHDRRATSEPVVGRFRTAPDDARDVTVAWSADTVGQGWGISKEFGGLATCGAIADVRPDVFIHVGDTIYADNPLAPERTLEDGRIWRNLVTPAKSKVAETLQEFRGNFQYNFLDEHQRRLNAEVAQVVLWDDHEVRNNWYPTQILEDERYTERSVALLAARAKRAFQEYTPGRWGRADGERVYRRLPYGPLLEIFALDMRSHRAANSGNRQTAAGPETALLGTAQLSWLKTALRESRALWKVVASDMPIGLLVRDGEAAFEGVANGEGPALGRELEIADLLSFLHRETVHNVVWLTGDVHYAAAHHYDPARARFKDFSPFWEFVAGPLHAGTFGPSELDDTFGPEVRFLGIPPGMKPNRPPSEGLQFFGTARLSGRSKTLTVRLHDRSGRALYSVDLAPQA